MKPEIGKTRSIPDPAPAITALGGGTDADNLSTTPAHFRSQVGSKPERPLLLAPHTVFTLDSLSN